MVSPSELLTAHEQDTHAPIVSNLHKKANQDEDK